MAVSSDRIDGGATGVPGTRHAPGPARPLEMRAAILNICRRSRVAGFLRLRQPNGGIAMYRSLFSRDLFAELDRLQREMQQAFDLSPSIRGLSRGGFPALNM